MIDSKILYAVGLVLIVIGCGSDSNGNGASGSNGGGSSGSGEMTNNTGVQTTAGSGPSENGNLTHNPMTDCAGGKYDPDNDLCWQDPPDETVRQAEEGTEYCESLDLAGHTDWRLPTISELRSLYRSGDDEPCYTVEWSMSWTEAPEGYCRVSNDVIETLDWEKEGCNPANCGFDRDRTGSIYYSRGPGANGCYWDPALSGRCEDARYVSSTESQRTGRYWLVSFARTPEDASYGIVAFTSEWPTRLARCVRNGR